MGGGTAIAGALLSFKELGVSVSEQSFDLGVVTDDASGVFGSY